MPANSAKDPAIILMALGQILLWAGLYYVFPALLLRWEQSLGWSKADLTGAISLAIILSGVTAPLAGRIIDIGKGPVLMAGSAVAGALGLFSLSFVTQVWQFYGACMAIGVCLAGCLYEPCFAIVTRARGINARHAIIVITLVGGFASSISFPIAHSLAEVYDWRVALRVFAAMVIVAGAPVMWWGATLMDRSAASSIPAGPDQQVQTHQPPGSRWRFIGSAVFWLVATGFALIAVVHGITLHHLLSLLNERQVNSEVAVVAAAFIGPMQVAGRLALFAAGDHISNHRIATSCFVVMAISIAMLIGAGVSSSLLVIFVILFGSSYGLVSIVRPLIAREALGQQNFGAKSGALALFYLVGSGSAPFLGSLIWNIGGYELVLPLLIVFAMMGLVLYLLANKLALARGATTEA